ncbi:translation elongation factor Ts [Paraperlucidibaca wandonensis]|jgi:elongation factor Ts|uniref:Elongation factor Ts n=1 Tax=Paraperlucidibaca wandonensis TaxID=1268273 RepID=A0ABW3HF24_9GAMM|nr:elongation factor Ts [Paraperlucidibaca sp.]MBQ0723299.1 elongation factor Ts [Paraperlucidibaca sp.]MBQ0842538.1 elongation factor Ts [Paraperlucidibaca sp.]|tara:strand:- start:2122 stop:3003 length:882 start_codon:yes stop_codon:yes gene_type:complete
MAVVTASLVKELRERTGLGMMECKKALQEADADIELAIDNLRKSGQAKAAKKAGNIAAEGAIILAADGNTAIALEVNCQTDFVARDASFTAFANKVAGIALAARETNAEKIAALAFDGMSVEEARVLLVQKLGENIQVRRAEIVEGAALATYVHGLKIGVIVAFNKADDEISKQVAMHVAASNPLVINAEDIPAEVLAKEQEIAAAKAAESGKPANIVEKMVEGTLKKFKGEVSLTEQAFVIDPDQKVGAVLAKAGLTVTRFIRLEVGEGIEKKEVDFAAEVAATQAAAAAAK